MNDKMLEMPHSLFKMCVHNVLYIYMGKREKENLSIPYEFSIGKSSISLNIFRFVLS